MSRKKEYFNEWVERKPLDCFSPLLSFFHRRMLRAAEQQIKDIKSTKILEVGVGFGYFAKIARVSGYRYVGVEMNKKLASSLRNQGFKVIRRAVPPFPKEPEVGTIWLSHLLEHCATFLEARDLVGKAYEALKPGGHIVIIGPDFLSWKQQFWDDHWSHGFPTTLRNCTQMLKDVGFSLVFTHHHNATVFQPILQPILNLLFSLIPYRFLDWLITPFTHRAFFYSFMSLFGWRQLYLIGRKDDQPAKSN